MAKTPRSKRTKSRDEQARAAEPQDPAPRESASQGAEPEPDEGFGRQFARVIVPREMDDDEKRRRWGLPARNEPDKTGYYIVELNVEHVDGLSGAEREFLAQHREVVALRKSSNVTGTRGRGRARQPAPAPERPPFKIAKSYYRCEFKDREWRALIALDEKRPVRERAIYRLWPDFPVTAQTDRSMTTIKADAAFRSFNATGEGITWAVIDSGIAADHPHFGLDEDHALRASAVVGLHRCFADVFEDVNGVRVNRGPLPSPDWDAGVDPEEQKRRVERHREHALKDDYGHGTHVAGIIAGQAPQDGKFEVVVIEHQYKMDADGNKIAPSFGRREPVCRERFRSAAPRCRLISLRVLDAAGKGRASQIIQALEYVREKINDNPKLMRVHGVNLSVGYEFDAELFACGQSPLCTAVDRLVQEGVVVVAAAGNTGYGSIAAAVGASKVGLSNTINDPGNAALAITVGSTHRDSPHTYGVSYFSSKGPTGDGRLKPDLVAPGERITSCAAGAKLAKAKEGSGISADGESACYYLDDSGTSMAAPHVSGAIAAFLSIRREFIGKPQEVKRILLASATPLGRERYFEGHGLVDLMRALQAV